MAVIKMDIVDLNLSLENYFNVCKMTLKEKIKMYKTLFNKKVVLIPIQD